MELNEQIEWNADLLCNFSEFFFGFKPYEYQKRFLNACLTSNRVAGKFPRQSGKSRIVAIYSLFKAITKPTSIVIVAPTQSQSSELYKKIRDMAIENAVISPQLKKCTATEMVLDNGSRILSLPCGPEGKTIRGYTADIAIIEEAGFMDDEIVNSVVIPMIASKKKDGQVIKIGTPWTRNHFFRSCFVDKNYNVISISYPEVVSAGQYTQEFIDEQRTQMLDIEFKTEYEAEFIDDMYAFFPLAVLENCKLNYSLIQTI